MRAVLPAVSGWSERVAVLTGSASDDGGGDRDDGSPSKAAAASPGSRPAPAAEYPFGSLGRDHRRPTTAAAAAGGGRAAEELLAKLGPTFVGAWAKVQAQFEAGADEGTLRRALEDVREKQKGVHKEELTHARFKRGKVSQGPSRNSSLLLSLPLFACVVSDGGAFRGGRRPRRGASGARGHESRRPGKPHDRRCAHELGVSDHARPFRAD